MPQVKSIYFNEVELSFYEHYRLLKMMVKDLVCDEVIQYNDFDKNEITAVFLSALCYLKKINTMQKIEEIIKKNGFNLKVTEETLELTNRFCIKLKMK